MAGKSKIILNILLLIFIFIILLSMTNAGRKITYFSTEHPKVTYYNPKYFKYINITSQRYGRRDPFYYVTIHGDLLVPIDNNVTVHYYFYELLTNVYKRGFIEIHIPFCDVIDKNHFFGTTFKKSLKFTFTCPLPAGEYHLYNMTIPIDRVPSGFPFTKGRIYCNATTIQGDLVGSGYINMELKQYTLKNE